MQDDAAGMHRVMRLRFHLFARPSLLDADVIVAGSAARWTARELKQVLQLVDPDAYEVHALPGDAVFGAVAVKRSVLAATWMEDIVAAVRGLLAPVMDPTVIWLGWLAVALEGEVLVASGPSGAGGPDEVAA